MGKNASLVKIITSIKEHMGLVSLMMCSHICFGKANLVLLFEGPDLLLCFLHLCNLQKQSFSQPLLKCDTASVEKRN